MKLETVREKQLDAYLANESVRDDEKLRLVLKGDPKRLQVYRVPIKFLIYNIRNGRFAAELLAKEGELKRKLDAGNVRDAKVIQKLLIDLNPSETAALKLDLRNNGQLDPGVITRDGAVINANRRMAILSALHDETHDPKFEYLRVARLPKEVDEKDLWRIEAGLQFAKEFRLDYSPINELLKLKEGRDSGLSPADISQALLGRFTPVKVEERLFILKLIESYLVFIEKDGQYNLVEGDVEKFNSLQSNVYGPLSRKGESDSKIAKLLNFAFLLIQKTDLTHWDIRNLGKIALVPGAYDELLKDYDPKKPNSLSSDKLDESFTTATEIMEAQKKENQNRPERLLKKALSALQGISSHHPKLTDALSKGLLADLKAEIDRLAKPAKAR